MVDKQGRSAAFDWIDERRTLRMGEPLLAAAEMFRVAEDLRMLTLVDHHDRPVGAVLDRDMRSLLYSPFGYSLLSNPSFAADLRSMVRPVQVVDINADAAEVLRAFAAANGACEGVVVTRGTRFQGVIGQAKVLRLIVDRDAAAAAARAARADRIDGASRRFEADARTLAQGLASVSAKVADASRRMTARAGDIGERIGAVASASGQAATNMSEIVARGEHLSAALTTIEAKITDARSATRAAVRLADDGSAEVASLALAAERINAATAEIDTIAQRTTMLSLNASIEAARAGTAGAGFAIVAGEVKALANQTRAAAGSINSHIAEIAGAVTGVRSVQHGLTRAVQTVETLSTAVDDAVRAQSLATQDISFTVGEVGIATAHIGENVHEIMEGANAARDDAGAMHDLAADLIGGAELLERELVALLTVLETA